MADLAIRAPHHVIPIGIDIPMFQETSGATFRERYLNGSDAPIVLNHGRLSFKKGLDILVRAMALVQREHRDVRLVLVGPDDEGVGSELTSLARDVGLTTPLVLTGSLRGHELASALSAADIWALPSHSENFGLAVVEAMAAGCAVIASPYINVVPDASIEGVLVMAENTPEETASAVSRLLNDRQRRLELGRNAYEYAQRYDWQNVATQFVDLYTAVRELSANT